MPDDQRSPETETSEPIASLPNRRRKLWRRVLMIGGPLAVLIAAGGLYVTGGRYAGTDNAYVHTHKVAVSADISGRVVDLKVHENE